MSPPVGPTGLAQRCSGKHSEAEPAPKWRVGATFGAFRSRLLFSNGADVKMEQLAVSASLEYRAAEKITLAVAGGGMFLGNLGGTPTSPGAVASIALAGTVIDQGEWTPFLMVSGSFAFSSLKVLDESYIALDVRAGLVAGWTLWERFTPYAVFRAFGGPVFYAGAIGTDAYHVQLGVGAVLGLPGGFDLSVEFVPLGEQRITAGAGFSF